MSDIQFKIDTLIKELNEASNLYYNAGVSGMTDKEYDEKLQELSKLEAELGTVYPNSPTIKVGAPTADGLPKFKHSYPALSLDKTKSIDELVSKFKKGIADSNSLNDKVVLMWKEDGSTIQAYYNHGRLDKLVTRGDGEVGSIVTHNASCLSGLPLTIPFDGPLVVRGEALMSYQEFDRINANTDEDSKYKNPRNLASATLQVLDAKENADRHLQLKAFNLVYMESLSDSVTFSKRLGILEKYGFNVVERKVVSIDELADAVTEMSSEVEDYAYPVDGLVAVMDNYAYSSKLQPTNHNPHILNGYAFKWKDECAETTLREIEWSPSRTGLLNPVAIFDPVELEGTTVQRASLHNLSIMRNMRIRVGSKISVYKANKIIPNVYKNLTFDSDPEYTYEFVEDMIGCCPTCKTKAAINISAEGIETVYCPNEECPEKMIGKLAHFCSRECMDIQGMSEETVQKLVEAGFVKEYIDLFKLDEKPGIAFLPGFGKQSWNKLCQAAFEAKSTDFVHFVASLSIPNIGKGQAKLLYNYFAENYDELSRFCDIDSSIYNPVELLINLVAHEFDFSAIGGFGTITANELSTWISSHLSADCSSPEMRVYTILHFEDAKSVSTISGNKVLSGKSFCITGKLSHFANRQQLVDMIEFNGGKWVDSVSSKTTYLINNDTESTSGKNKKAKSLNILIINEEQFLQMLV